ncbi:MAG TPA: FAD-dependent monooxygenase, partial [Chitinophagaceae bacterium]|nr:FAD-dependent monooxygenase [Chitinophagaceae bacterium]
MKVFKFGGASVNSIDRIKNLQGIVKQFANEPLMIIISAMGKTTNALEKVTEAFYAGKQEEALQLFGIIKNQHITTAKYLLVTEYHKCIEQLNNFFTEVEWLLHDKPQREYDYYYDQVVCIGELLSTAIVSHYLNESRIGCKWIDVRDIIRTDDNFRDAIIDWNYTKEKVQQFFDTTFGDVVKLMPTLVDDFFTNPTSSLVTVKCFPWVRSDKFALIGDAAHAIVPFFGQGMNCGFEDCAVLNGLIDKYNNDWTKILEAYQLSRKPDSDAIADLAINNFIEMRDKVADPKFLLQKKIEANVS